MAASVLLSADNTVPAFAAGNSGPTVAAGNGVGAPCPASWNRSLDRALDEAAATGCLNLSGRKLKEFPRSAVSHDLTDTTRADLSRNRLSELPVEVCVLVSLENLNLYQNCLRSLPEIIINLQALTYLNISRNQLSTLPAPVCSLPLKVLIACNNKLLSLPEELGQLRQLTELDVSCNEIQTLPAQVGQLEALRDLNIRRNHLARLPPELADLPLVRLDFSCNKVTSIPVCYRNLRHLQSIILDNNPLQTPPAQICIKGKVHIFKYLNMEACKTASELPDYDRKPPTFGSCVEELYPGRPYGALDSGFNSVDSGNNRWSGNEATEELSDLPVRVAELTKEQRLRREREREREEHKGCTATANGTMETEMEQIDFIDSCTGEEEDDGRNRASDSVSLSSQFMAYIERRITRSGSPVKSSSFKDTRIDDPRRHTLLHSRSVPDGVSPYASHTQRLGVGGVERVRREAQLAAMQYEEERQRTRSAQREAVMSYVKHKATPSPTKLSPIDSETVYPSRRSTHTDDTALFMSLSGMSMDGCVSRATDTTPSCLLQQGEDRSTLSSAAESAAPRSDQEEISATTCHGLMGEEAELVDQLRKSIESRLKVSLPSDLGAALTDGVVLCHLANHVRPRSVPSIHVPSPAVPKLTMAKCRRNVENFLEACRRIGVPQESLCSVGEVLEGGGICVFRTVDSLLTLAPPLLASPPAQLAGFALFYLSIMSLLCILYCHLLPGL
ncbi:leucine-rich repeat and calponin homology domain-containing protein 3 isoform X9 [Denticeps clupeoides]|uniref:leucine-rich repeat and calponin homology domain-containing protein 3 isoform X9 n=1 Tax=Denticeps clupeoides TaxID=299321 RepID=UPI0010A4919B|nr:leucine-rich repeat and calponin homology domain-containing protein 3 isoform X9 [Denticeps clupeoides]